jgi:hypothetical protein
VRTAVKLAEASPDPAQGRGTDQREAPRLANLPHFKVLLTLPCGDAKEVRVRYRGSSKKTINLFFIMHASVITLRFGAGALDR